MQPHPQPEQRVGEAVALLPRRHEVHVLEPRQVVLGGARRAVQPLRDLGERERLVVGEDVEDGLERAVAARAVQPQLVAEAAPVVERAVAATSAPSSALIGSAVPPSCAMRIADRAHVGGAAVGQRLHGAAEVVAIVGRHLLVAVEGRRQQVA